MVTWREPLRGFSFQEVRQTYPQLQKRIYDVLLQLTPRQLAFEMAQVQGNRTFSSEIVDQPTFEIMSRVMKGLLDEQKLLFTRDDLLVCFQRFHELIFAYEAVRQGILTEKIEGNEIIYEVNSEPIAVDFIPRTRFRPKNRQVYQGQIKRKHDTIGPDNQSTKIEGQ
jgi:hypothetical protein